MGRGKVQLRPIENPTNRQTTFSKRKSGLIKKAYEIAVLCETDVAVIIFSPKGKLYEYSTDSKMRKILDRYEQYSYAEKEVLGSNAQQGDDYGNCTEHSNMKHRFECLQKTERQLLGEDIESLNLIELQNIEQKLEDDLRNIRARQNSLLLDSIAELQEKGKLLQERNNALEKKITQLEEENRALTQAARKEQQSATGETCSIQDLPINDHVTTLDAGAQVLDSWMLMLGGLDWLELLEENSWACKLLTSDL